MPSFTTPDSLGASLNEYNPCHLPKGPGGGQFAAKGQGQCAVATGGDIVDGSAMTAGGLLRVAKFVQTGNRLGHNVKDYTVNHSTLLNTNLHKVFGADRDEGIRLAHDIAARMVQDVDLPDGMKFTAKVFAPAGSDGVAVVLRALKPEVAEVQTMEDAVLIARVFTRDADGNLQVEHNSFHIPEEYQGHGIAKAVLRNSVGVYKEHGVTRVYTFANIDVGGYAWAKYGFLPTDKEFADDVRVMIDDRFHAGEMDRETAQRLTNLTKRASYKDTWLWDVADAQVRGKAVGKLALKDTNWNAYLKMNDERQLYRLLKYVGAVR